VLTELRIAVDSMEWEGSFTMRKIFNLGTALALTAAVGCGSQVAEQSSTMEASPEVTADVSRFLGDYELIDDISGNCKQRDYDKIKISHPEVVTGINYDDPNAPPALEVAKDSLIVERLEQSDVLGFDLGHTQINGKAQQVIAGFGECSFYRARLVGDTVSTSTKGCLQLFGWEQTHQMTLKGETLTISRPHPSPEYNFECSYKKIRDVK